MDDTDDGAPELMDVEKSLGVNNDSLREAITAVLILSSLFRRKFGVNCSGGGASEYRPAGFVAGGVVANLPSPVRVRGCCVDVITGPLGKAMESSNDSLNDDVKSGSGTGDAVGVTGGAEVSVTGFSKMFISRSVFVEWLLSVLGSSSGDCTSRF